MAEDQLVDDGRATITDARIGVEQIREIEAASYRVIERLREAVFAPDGRKSLDRLFSISEASEMVGRSQGSIRQAEANGRLPAAPRGQGGRRQGYTLTDINNMRREFGTFPWRSPSDDPIVLAIQNFKGGVGKSTITAHISQHLALQGYRVCVIDCDPQGSTTSLFGINPDYDLDIDDTLFPFLQGEGPTDIRYAVRDTYWEQLALVPANLDFYESEYQLAARLPGNSRLLDKLREGIVSIQDDFDVIVVDPPPALGMISLSVLRAANALVVPCRPATIDFGSTAHFFTMLGDALETLSRHGFGGSYKFLKVLANDMDEGKSAHTNITSMMQQVYGPHMLNTVMKDSAEIDNACGRLMTVYELNGPITSRDVHKRAKAYLDAMCDEIELLIRKTWPSHTERLRADGLV